MIVECKNYNDDSKLTEYNLTDALHLESFAMAHYFELAASVTRKTRNVCGYTYTKTAMGKRIWSKHRGFIYIICANNRIVKIGQGESTIQSRFSSYTAGAKKNRKKGTCSVTNWVVSEFFRTCLEMGIELDIYVCPVPETTTIIEALGREIEAHNKHAYAYEAVALAEYEEHCGMKPMLCKNTSQVE